VNNHSPPGGSASTLRDKVQATGDGNIHLSTALLALAVGLSPGLPTEDGEKRPDGLWKQYQTTPATREEVIRWYRKRRTGNALFTGYGDVEALEWDSGGAVYQPFLDAAEKLGLGDLVERVRNGYEERSPSGGFHWLYRCPERRGNTELAKRPNPDRPDKPRILIETRGVGGFLVIAPSNGKVHPSGGTYTLLRGGLDSIVTITPDEREALWSLARSFDEMPEEEIWDMEAKTASGEHQDGVRPGEDFNARARWEDIVEPAGWVAVHQSGEVTYWRRPDKDHGWSATTGKTKGFRVFTSSTSLKAGESYSRFGLYCQIRHQGNWKACVNDLAEQGYGTWIDDKGEEHQNPRPKGARSQKKATAGDQGRQEKPHENGQAGAGINYDALEDEQLGIEWAENIQDEAVEWINEKRLAAGKLHILAGAGGLGKSQYAIAEIGAVTTGGMFPDGTKCLRSGVAIILAAEDGKADTIVPRLRAADADLKKVVVLRTTLVIPQPAGRPPLISFGNFQNLAYWEAIFKRLNPVLLVADPIPAFMGPSVNDHRNADVRRVLEPFVELMEKYRVATEGVTHVGKSIKDKTATDQILGSVAYGNLARRINIAWIDPEVPGRYIVTNPKLSLGPRQPAIGYTIEPFDYPKGEKVISTSRAKFEDKTFEADEYELRCGQKEARRGKPRGPDAVRLTELTTSLFDFLKGKGPVLVGEIAQAMGEKGLIGVQVEDPKTGRTRWTMFTNLYVAIKRVPALPSPDDGWMVVTSKDDSSLLSVHGKARWLLKRADSPY
jgi:hypothetical protein